MVKVLSQKLSNFYMLKEEIEGEKDNFCNFRIIIDLMKHHHIKISKGSLITTFPISVVQMLHAKDIQYLMMLERYEINLNK
jgi:hypothetical protein